jgi:hypothetical protein
MYFKISFKKEQKVNKTFDSKLETNLLHLLTKSKFILIVTVPIQLMKV